MGGPRTSVFLSYRRSDSAGTTGRIRDRLNEHYGEGQVFQDVDDIEKGDDFLDAISSELDRTDVQLVVIGAEWTSVTGADGGRRLDDPDDHLAHEIAIGLQRGDELRVIPVLVDGAKWPAANELPGPLSELSARNYVELRNDDWDDDLEGLLDDIGGRPYHRGLPRRAWPMLAILVVVVAVALFVAWPRAQEQMTGAFRVAVAEVVSDDEGLDDLADRLSQTVYRGLDDELSQLNSQGFDFVVWSPGRTGAVGSAEEAAARADEIDADVVVYATLASEGMEPEFYLRQRPGATGAGEPHFAGAEEVTGQYDLGTEILGSGLTVGGLGPQQELVMAMSARTRALVQFVVGLSYFVEVPADYRSAEEAFQMAADEREWLDDDGKEVLYLFLGNTAGKLGELDAAERNYQRALELSDDLYARAHLGLAEVTYQRARGTCETGEADGGGLEAALGGFGRARELGGPPVSEIEAKARLGTARVQRCLSQAGLGDYWAAADADLRFVISEYDSRDGRNKSRLGELASEAHAELALVLAPSTSESTEAAAAYGAAITETRAAIELTNSNCRAATFERRLAFFYERLGRFAEALDSTSRAGDLWESCDPDFFLSAVEGTVTAPPATDEEPPTMPATSTITSPAEAPSPRSEVVTVAFAEVFDRRDVPVDAQVSMSQAFLAFTGCGYWGDSVTILEEIEPWCTEEGDERADDRFQIIDPDGGVVYDELGTEGVFQFDPTHPTGEYLQRRESAEGVITTRAFDVTSPPVPSSRILDVSAGDAATTLRIALAGHPPYVDVELDLSRLAACEQPCDERELSFVGTVILGADELGQGLYVMPLPAEVSPGEYCMALRGECESSVHSAVFSVGASA